MYQCTNGHLFGEECARRLEEAIQDDEESEYEQQGIIACPTCGVNMIVDCEDSLRMIRNRIAEAVVKKAQLKLDCKNDRCLVKGTVTLYI